MIAQHQTEAASSPTITRLDDEVGLPEQRPDRQVGMRSGRADGNDWRPCEGPSQPGPDDRT